MTPERKEVEAAIERIRHRIEVRIASLRVIGLTPGTEVYPKDWEVCLADLSALSRTITEQRQQIETLNESNNGLVDKLHESLTREMEAQEKIATLREQIETLTGQLEGYISTNAHGLRVIEQQAQEIATLREQVAVRDRAMRDIAANELIRRGWVSDIDGKPFDADIKDIITAALEAGKEK